MWPLNSILLFFIMVSVELMGIYFGWCHVCSGGSEPLAIHTAPKQHHSRKPGPQHLVCQWWPRSVGFRWGHGLTGMDWYGQTSSPKTHGLNAGVKESQYSLVLHNTTNHFRHTGRKLRTAACRDWLNVCEVKPPLLRLYHLKQHLFFPLLIAAKLFQIASEQSVLCCNLCWTGLYCEGEPLPTCCCGVLAGRPLL